METKEYLKQCGNESNDCRQKRLNDRNGRTEACAELFFFFFFASGEYVRALMTPVIFRVSAVHFVEGSREALRQVRSTAYYLPR